MVLRDTPTPAGCRQAASRVPRGSEAVGESVCRGGTGGFRWDASAWHGNGGAEESRAIPYCVVCVCEESWYFVSDQCARLLTPPSEMAIGKADPELRF